MGQQATNDEPGAVRGEIGWYWQFLVEQDRRRRDGLVATVTVGLLRRCDSMRMANGKGDGCGQRNVANEQYSIGRFSKKGPCERDWRGQARRRRGESWETIRDKEERKRRPTSFSGSRALAQSPSEERIHWRKDHVTNPSKSTWGTSRAVDAVRCGAMRCDGAGGMQE